MPQVGEVVGHLLQRGQARRPWASSRQDLGRVRRRPRDRQGQAARSPLCSATSRSGPAIHVFGVVQGRSSRPTTIRDLGFGQPGASWTTPENTEAARRRSSTGSTSGYFTKGFNGTDYDPAWQNFTKGDGVFLIAGSWLQRRPADGHGRRRGVHAPAGRRGRRQPRDDRRHRAAVRRHATASKNKDAAAAYIDFITNADAMKVLAETGNLPVVETEQQQAPDAARSRTCSRPSAPSPRGRPACPTSTTPRRPSATRSVRRCRTCSPSRSTPQEFLETLAEGLRRLH